MIHILTQESDKQKVNKYIFQLITFLEVQQTTKQQNLKKLKK